MKKPNIDLIAVVCVEGWSDVLGAYAKQFNISQLNIITFGGQTEHEFIYKGFKALKDVAEPEDIVLVHDSIRPMIRQDIITECIIKVIKYKMPYLLYLIKKL